MERKYTIEEIKNYILKQDSLGDVLYNLNHDKIMAANSVEELDEFDEDNDGLCSHCDGHLNDHEDCCPYYTDPRQFIIQKQGVFIEYDENIFLMNSAEYNWTSRLSQAQYFLEDKATEIAERINGVVKSIYDDEFNN